MPDTAPSFLLSSDFCLLYPVSCILFPVFMNWLDWLLLFIIAISAFLALLRGFVTEVVMLVATFAGLALGAWKYQAAGRLFRSWVAHPEIRDGLGFLLVFFAVILIAWIVTALLRKLLSAVGLRWFDRLLGLALGFVRGVLICVVVVVILTAFPLAGNAVFNSRLAPDFLQAGAWMVRVLPPPIRRRFHQGWQRFGPVGPLPGKTATLQL